MRSRGSGVGPPAHGAVTWTDWIDAARAAAVLALSAVGEQTRPERPQADGSAALAADPDDLVAAAYERHQREIHSFALHSTRDPEVAADVTQETFPKLLLAAQGFSGREVALAIGRSELATRTLLCRARLQLRTRLADHAPES